MYVELYRLSKSGSEKIGTITWTGHAWKLEPHSETLENILAQPVYHPKYPRGVNSLESPELFLRSLCFQYRSVYLRATPAYEDSSDDKGKEKRLRHRRKAMSGTKTLWLVRHGKTALNASNPDEDRIRGWRDVPLNDEGQEEARRLARWFKGKPISEIISSDFQRTEQTAIKIAIASGTEIRELSRAMRPWNVGKYTGELSSKVHPILEEYCTERPDENLPGGESFNEFKGRCLEYVARLMEADPPAPLLVVSHFRNLKLVQGWVEAGCQDPGPEAELDMETFLNWKDVPTGTILKLTQTEGRPWRWELIERAQGQNKEESEKL